MNNTVVLRKVRHCQYMEVVQGGVGLFFLQWRWTRLLLMVLEINTYCKSRKPYTYNLLDGTDCSTGIVVLPPLNVGDPLWCATAKEQPHPSCTTSMYWQCLTFLNTTVLFYFCTICSLYFPFLSYTVLSLMKAATLAAETSDFVQQTIFGVGILGYIRYT